MLILKVLNDQEIAARLRHFRKITGTPNKTISVSLGVVPGFVSDVFNGKKKCSRETLEKICEVMGVPMKEFYDINEIDDCELIINESADNYNVQKIKQIAKKIEAELLDAVEKYGMTQDKVDQYADLLGTQTKVFVDQNKQ